MTEVGKNGGTRLSCAALEDAAEQFAFVFQVEVTEMLGGIK